MKTPMQNALALLDYAIKLHNPSHVFALFSGGHDSLCSSHIASLHPKFTAAAHINTGIGVKATREFVRATCQAQNWPLKEYHPPVSYDDIVLKHGFPGPGGHFYMYNRLKERCLDALIRDHKLKARDRILLVTGVRLAESSRRMGNVESVKRSGCTVWSAPILHWSTEDKNNYIDSHKLTRNPVVDKLCMSGECLCGAFARPGEMVEIEAAYPETAARIRALQDKARAAGVHDKWGVRPPRAKQRSTSATGLELCWSCEAKRETDV